MKALKHYFRMLTEDRHRGAVANTFYGLLTLISKGYLKGLGIRRWLFDKKLKKSKTLTIPVISVGNVTWGGSGKTPLVEYFVRRISDQHKVPVILTRGYSHDEIEQYREHLPRVMIGVGKDRARTAARIQKKHAVDIAVLDDGFQHWSIHRDLDVITINSLNPFGNGKLIPRGPLREPIDAIGRAQLVVLTHVNLVKPDAVRLLKRQIRLMAPDMPIAESFLEPLFFYRARKRQRVSLEKLSHQRVTTFSAVGVPRSFQLILSNWNIKPVRNFEFTDHHMFSKKDLDEIKTISETSGSDEIVTTEKDFFRAPDQITDILDPLILATRLKVSSGEEVINKHLTRLLGAPN